jgi:hypothetical protein
VTTVQEAGSHRSITDATIEVLTSQDEIVATLTPDATGRATRDLTEGSYVVRITHPRYAAETRRVQVLSRQTVEIRANLRTGSTAASPARSSSAVERAVDEGLRGTRRALGF